MSVEKAQPPKSQFEAVDYANPQTVIQNPNNTTTTTTVQVDTIHSPIQHVYIVQPSRGYFERLVRYLCCLDLIERSRRNEFVIVQQTKTAASVRSSSANPPNY